MYKCIKRTDIYIKYIIDSKVISGYIVLEKYDDIWNLELMTVYPTNHGYGTKFLRYVLDQERLNPVNMTVCPTSLESQNFFAKFNFK